MNHRGTAFFQGLLGGILISLMIFVSVTLYPQAADLSFGLPPAYSESLDVAGVWIFRNLGYSLIPFGITLVLYLFTLRRLVNNLEKDAPVEKITQGEHLLEIWISLFFGIGVIWTAIGMRGALIFALGDVSQVTGSAIEVLERMVDGGMLTALSTTILGGAGGYFMRLGKSLYLGMRLNNYYSKQEQEQQQRIEILLSDIKQSVNPSRHQQVDLIPHGE